MASVADEFVYDVFLNFRGEDTRYGFIGYLKKALDDKGVRTFIDDEKVEKGDEVTPALLQAIDESMMAIVVLSKNYASSSFCLQELSKILDSIKDKGRSVFPVFYKVNPSDVHMLKKSYGKAMDKHKDNSNLDEWKASLQQVADLSGFHYMKGDGNEHEFIDKIVEQVLKHIKPVALHVGDYLVGLEHQKQHMVSLLNVGSDDTTHMVGIVGIGGIGKTTLALEVYNSIVSQFKCSCFLPIVREQSDNNGLISLQNVVLSQIVGEKNTGEITSVEQGISKLRQRLKQKNKVLLVLDDVDKEEQLKAIAGSSDWFGRGSRVIITTRDKNLLTRCGVERTYEVNGLNDEDAFDLVGWKALKNNYSPSYKDILLEQKYRREFDLKNEQGLLDYANVLNRVVRYASGHPLALEVMGSYLFNKTIEQCKDALDRYEKVPHKKIQTTLQLSYDALQDDEKTVFLDIACCFKGFHLTRVENILHAHHGEIMKDHINVLVEKSLIKISEYGHVTLHDLVEDMGKEIVRQESSDDPGNRSRLWSSQDIKKVLEENKGTSKIEIIHLNRRINIEWNEEAFKKMENLKTLIIKHVHFSKSPKHLPNSLRVLECHVDLHSSFNPFQREGFLTKKFQNMRVLNLGNSDFLVQIPDISGLPNLEEFSIQNSAELIEIDKSVGFLRNLKILRFIDCTKIESVPPLSLASLEELELSYCSCLESFPLMVNGFGGQLKILKVINCGKIKIIPPLKLSSLETFYLFDCTGLESFPQVVDGFGDKLKTMSVSGCHKLRTIPLPMLPSLENLDVSNCKSLESFQPVVDGHGDKLKIMCVRGCDKLRSIPLPMLPSLENLDVSNCKSLESFQPVVDGFGDKLKTMRVRSCIKLRSIPLLKLDSLEELDLSGCDSLESFPPVVGGFLGKLKTLLVTNCHNLRSFPDLKLDSLETLDLSNCYRLESFPPVVDGFLGKLKFLNIEFCIMLKNIPRLRLTSLEHFNLSCCDSLESFPEILGEMRNRPGLLLGETPIKELPFPFQKLTQPQVSCNCGYDYLPSRMLSDFATKNEEKVNAMQSAHIKYICVRNCKLSDKYLSINLMLFANVKELHLTNNQFTVIPKSIEKCHFLWKLVLDDCKELQEIKGIPPCIRMLSALNCMSLTLSCKIKLLNQELHKDGNTWFRLPRVINIPEWFDHKWEAGLSISFWFHNMFPVIALCVVSPLTWGGKCRDVRVIINGNTFFYTHDLRRSWPNMYHLHIFHLQMENFNDMDKALLENKWNKAEIDFGFPFHKSGIHVLKKKSNMMDIRFTNPENDVNSRC